ncbi:MAG: hypothetical protein AB7G28_15765 [Pirellulales bacterium]
MNSRRRTVVGRVAIVLGTALAACVAPPACAITTHLYQDFDGLPLQPSVDELPTVPNAFTHNAPSNWIRDASGVPGVGNPDIGVFEWEGWSFARKSFWESVGPRFRDQFTLGKDTIAVAETDAWNDKGNPANTVGFYDTFLTTPLIDFTNAEKGGTKLSFNSSWMPGCCDDGERFDPDQNNQRASIRLRFPNNNVVPVLRWESAPYVDSQGHPSLTLKPNFSPNPFYKTQSLNERVYVDLAPYLSGPNGALARIEYGVTDAGDDGWWAVDVMHMFSFSLVPADMNVDGIVDENDVPAFALGIQNPEAYSNTYFGEIPVTRGSLDSVFDFDDIPWFVDQLESSGVGSAAALVQAALVGGAIPEPSTLVIAALVGTVAATIRPRRRAIRSAD